MAHRNARLTPHGRRLIVQRVRQDGWPVAHVAKAMGISRQCAYRWLKRWTPRVKPGWRTGRLVRTRHRIRPRRRSKNK